MKILKIVSVLQAAEVIKQQLEKRRTVKLLCLLGDATDDEECYREAWELSEHKSGRAQRHWALYYYNRRQVHQTLATAVRDSM